MPIGVAGLYAIRSRKYHTSNPTNHWYNNYLVFDSIGSNYAQWEAFATVLQNFESDLHFSSVFFDRVTVSTYASDTSPYDADEFISFEREINGSRNEAVVTLLGLEVCWYIAKTVESGRSGKVFYRGALCEEDVGFGGRGFMLSDPTSMQGVLNSAITTNGLDDYLNQSGDIYLAMGKGITTPLNHRFVVLLQSKGVRTVNMDHRYFNRSS